MSSISFWAKTTTDQESGEKKPGISVDEHMLNVGSVALALSETMPSLLNEFGLCGSNVAAFAALHDLGKISPGFQRKCLAWLKENDLETQDHNGGGDSAWSNHAKMTQIAVHKVLADMKIQNKTAGYIAAILGAHHGTIQDGPEIINNRKINEMQRKKHFNIDWISEWEKSARRVMEYFKADLSCVSLNDNSPELWFLAGITTISDWIGSDEKHFQSDSALSTERRFARALEVVHEIGLTLPKIYGGLNFSEIFGFPDETKPNNMQLKAVECIQGPGVYIIEAPMGMGKTEAALWAAYNLLLAEKAKGIYFALPTQITSNRMHLRMKSFINKIAPGSTPSCLIHGNSWLITDGLPQTDQENLENSENAKTRRSWFVGNKRSLIAPFGVGTIDQALLGVVAAKYFFLRHFALAGKVVILDEIHSYDLYTGTLVTKLVQTLKNLGCTVIILSATLTEKRRNELLLSSTVLSSDSYPLITGFTKHDPNIFIKGECDRLNKKKMGKEIDIRFKNENNAQEEAVEAARRGSVVLWVCNTVRSSQEQYAKFVQYKDEFSVGLLHSRFPFWRREQLEDEWMKRLGKENKNRDGCILVSTQIVEQSVDIDSDLLITELAPTDMLFQRLGRLWRHPRENRLGKPIAIILEEKHTIEEYKTMDQKEIQNSFGPKAKIYFPDILLNSLEVWKQYDTITIPDQIRSMLEATYQDDKDFPDAWLKFSCDRFGSEASKRFLAIRNSNYWQLALNDEEGLQTRINEIPTVSVILCKQIQMNHVILLNNENIQFKNDRFDIKLARAIHKNLVKIPKCHFNLIVPDRRLQNYLHGEFAIGIVADGKVEIDGLKDGTVVQWGNDEGVKINRAGGRA